MENYINFLWDGLAFVLIIAAMINCYKKGFMYSIVKTVGSVAAVVVSVVFSAPVSHAVYDTLFRYRVIEGFEKLFSSFGEIDVTGFQIAVEEKLAALPGNLGPQMTPVFREYIDSWFESFSKADFSAFAETFAKSVAEPVIVGVIRCVAFLIMFLALSLLVKMLASLFKGVKYIPVLGSLNAVLGSVLGILQGAIHVIILCGILWVIINFTGGVEGIITPEIIDKTIILKLVFGVFPILGGVLT